jgi:hypothetical protein
MILKDQRRPNFNCQGDLVFLQRTLCVDDDCSLLSLGLMFDSSVLTCVEIN